MSKREKVSLSKGESDACDMFCHFLYIFFYFFIVKTYYNAISQNSSCDAHQLFYFFLSLSKFSLFFFTFYTLKNVQKLVRGERQNDSLCCYFSHPFLRVLNTKHFPFRIPFYHNSTYPMLCDFKYEIFLFYVGWTLIMTIFVVLFFPKTKRISLKSVNTIWHSHWYWHQFVDLTKLKSESIELSKLESVNSLKSIQLET